MMHTHTHCRVECFGWAWIVLSITETINNVANCLRLNAWLIAVSQRPSKNYTTEAPELVLSCMHSLLFCCCIECMRHGMDNAVSLVLYWFFSSFNFLHSVEMICVISSHAYPLKTPTNMIIPWFVFSILPLIFFVQFLFFIIFFFRVRSLARFHIVANSKRQQTCRDIKFNTMALKHITTLYL